MIATTVPIEDPDWSEFATSHPKASVFHLPAWTKIIADCYHFDAFALVVRGTGHRILAGLPVIAVRRRWGVRRWVSLPFSDVCPVLACRDVGVDEVIQALSDHVCASGIRELEVRTSLPAAAICHPVAVGFQHLIELPEDPHKLRPKKHHRNTRNRAERNGVEVVRGSTAKDVATYYKLHILTRRRLGVPVQPRRFFDLICERLLAPGFGFVATAMVKGEPVAAGLYLSYNRTLVAKFGASDPNRQGTGAGYLIDWEVMRAACTEGYHTLDLGRTDLDAEGLRRYKSGWGGEERLLSYSYISRQAPVARRPRVGGLSKEIIRRSPVCVCRALGEVLYRWSA